MTYTGLELFMDNLKQLSYSNDNPLINNNPQILFRRPQIQVLYKELSFLIQIMFTEKQNCLNETEQIKNLKRRFKDVAQEAYSIVGLFVYSVNYINTTGCEFNCKSSRNLEHVMRDLKSIKEEFTMILLDSLEMDSSSTVESLKTQKTTAAGTSCTRNPLGTKKVMEKTIVGLKRDVDLIRDKILEYQKQLDVVSIVGMGGVGKTTLATKVFNDPCVEYHFHIRAWLTVSQSYEQRDLLIQILASIGIEFDHQSDDFVLRGKLHKRLMGQRYLIVVDDIWSIKAWNDLKLFFPNCNTGSRILLTSRLKEVALHAKSEGLIHELECLTDEESWELLCKKVFHGNDCPESLIKPGMQIACSCHGLPLAVVVIAGVLAKAVTNDQWERIAQSVSSYIVSGGDGPMDILGLSYEHLPPHLKDCFLYLGGFPKDHKFQVRKLIWLWIAEGFVQEDGNRSLEEIGEDYLMELVDRNLVVVADRKFNGSVKACSVHDLLTDLCFERATKANFWLKINTPMITYHFVRKYKPHRIFTNMDFFINNFVDQENIDNVVDQPSLFLGEVQSLLFSNGPHIFSIPKEYLHSYPLLMVLDLQNCERSTFPHNIGLLVHLRYLAFWCGKDFPPPVCHLWNLHTIIARSYDDVYLPEAISNLVNLRHLWSDGVFHFLSLEKPMNLLTISDVIWDFLDDEAESYEKCFPGIKKLTCRTFWMNPGFGSLNSLETLKWIHMRPSISQIGKFHVTFPASLKKLTLEGLCLPWSDMPIIQSLPNLEVLKILKNSFWGSKWETGEAQFRQLKLLELKDLIIQHWEASRINFPCLQHLVLVGCPCLNEIPLEIGYISTLKLIDVVDCSSSIVNSVLKIREEQQYFGNDDLKTNVKKSVFNVVGRDHDAELIKGKLVEDQKELDILSIVGKEGIGKTTLALKVFNDPFVSDHFDVLAWITLSQIYGQQDFGFQILYSNGFDLESASHSEVCEMYHSSLMGERYLIVVDDIWNNEAWDGMREFFPNDHNGSRILLTSRFKEVALHANFHGLIHELGSLTDEESWELLCKIVFHDNDCPESLIEPGMIIAKYCDGVPLQVAIQARLLAKELSKDFWEKSAQELIDTNLPVKTAKGAEYLEAYE